MLTARRRKWSSVLGNVEGERLFGIDRSVNRD
jgi:hypothetical protein